MLPSFHPLCAYQLWHQSPPVLLSLNSLQYDIFFKISFISYCDNIKRMTVCQVWG
jgi:hypothetical protein